jgi:thymidylate synthase
LCALAQKLNVKPGIYTHSISNAHIYDNHYEGAKELIGRKNNHPNIFPKFPENIYDRAEKRDENLVNEIYEAFALYYKPSDPILGLDIIK